MNEIELRWTTAPLQTPLFVGVIEVNDKLMKLQYRTVLERTEERETVTVWRDVRVENVK